MRPDFSAASRRLPLAAILFLLLVCRLSGVEVVTSVTQLTRLTADQIRTEPRAEMEGVVTYADPTWRMVFLHVGDRFLFLQYAETTLNPGDRVRIQGKVTGGHLDPYVMGERVEVLSTGHPMPEPMPLDLQEFDESAASGRWVKASGTVENVVVDFGWTSLNCRSVSGAMFRIHVPEESSIDASLALLGRSVDVEGNLGIALDADDRVSGYMLFVQSKDDFHESPESKGSSSPELNETEDIVSLSESPQPHEVVDFEGICTYSQGEVITVADATGGVRIKVPGGIKLAEGMRVRVIGTQVLVGMHPSITARVIQPLGEGEIPQPVRLDHVSPDSDQGRLVIVRGDHPRLSSHRDRDGHRMLELTDSQGNSFVVSLEDVDEASLREFIRDAEQIEVRGTCVFGLTNGFFTHVIHGHGLEALHVTKEKPLLDSRTMVALFGIMAGLSLIGAVRSEWLRRKVHERTTHLSEMTAQLQAAYRAIDEAILFHDLEERVVMTDGRLDHWFGIPVAQGESCANVFDILCSEKCRIVPSNPDELAEPASPEDELDSFTKRLAALRANPDRSMEFEFTLSEPEARTIKCVIAPVQVDGEILGRIWAFRDLTKEKELYASLVQAQKMEAVGRLAGGIAHDFNNLLTGITGNLAVAKLNTDVPLRDSLEHLDAAESAAVRASELVKQMLGFSRKAHLELKVCDVNDVVTRLSELIRHSLGATVDIRLELDDAIAPVKLDGTQLEQVLMNMCVNARDALPDTGGVIEFKTSTCQLEASESRQAGDYTMISVIDNGSGMPPEVLSKIFEPFFTTKEQGKGTGLGLAMSFGLVEQHGGWIECDSEVGNGTEFRIYLPTHLGPLHQTAETTIKRETALDAVGDRRKIMVVDDESVVRTVAAGILRKCDFEVITAENGREAVEKAASALDSLDAVLLDLTMPVMSGKEALRRLKDLRPDLPVIICSGFLVDLDTFSKEVGVAPDGFVQKPYDLSVLIAAIRECLADTCENDLVLAS